MAHQPTVMQDIRDIEDALRAFVAPSGREYVYVFESSGPYLRAIVVSDFFANMNAAARQEAVRQHLRQNLQPRVLAKLFGVHPYTWEEYGDNFQQSSSTAHPEAE